jgi:hypothetical protein
LRINFGTAIDDTIPFFFPDKGKDGKTFAVCHCLVEFPVALK